MGLTFLEVILRTRNIVRTPDPDNKGFYTMAILPTLCSTPQKQDLLLHTPSTIHYDSILHGHHYRQDLQMCPAK